MSNSLVDGYEKWQESGEPRDQNNSVPHEIKTYYLYRTLQEYGVKTFVESGTSYGDAVDALLPYVDEVYTMEAWKQAFDYSSKRFSRNPNVNIFFGDSGKILPKILPDIDSAVFWLDAHYSGDGTAKLDKETPILAELNALARANNSKYCIVIDDARGFGVWQDYPTVEWLEFYCSKYFPNHKFFLEGDEIFILPND